VETGFRITGLVLQKAGLKSGDIVVSIDGKAATDLQRTIQLIGMTGFGESCKVDVERNGTKETLTISGEWPLCE